MEKIHVLLVEDELTLAMIIKDTLEEQEFIITTASDGEEGLRTFFAQKPDIVVADVMMPRMDGFEMVRRIRQTDKLTPVLFLTARSAINDVVEGFELGANDYLKKPFGMQELIVRLKALMHKAFIEKEVSHSYEIGDYQFNPVTQQLTFAGATQELSHRESEILKRLCNNRNEVVSSQSILLELWGDDSFFNSRSLHVFITKLRHKLAKDSRVRIVNVRGIGFPTLFQLQAFPQFGHRRRKVSHGEIGFSHILQKGFQLFFTKTRHRLYLELSSGEVSHKRGRGI